MADFLTRMTQRTLGLLPVVQPIGASKFASEAMGADVPGGLPSMNPFPDQAEESFEDWEEMSERVPPAPLPQNVVPRGVHNPTVPVPDMPASFASPQEQPSTPKVQPAKPAPIRPHEVQPLRETTGGSQPSPLVPHPQAPPAPKPGREMPQGSELPGREQTPPLPSPKHDPDPYRVGAGLAPALGIEASTPTASTAPLPSTKHAPALGIEASTPTASTAPTTKPHRGQGKPSSQSDVGTRLIASKTGEPLVPAQSGEIPQIDQNPDVGTRFIASRLVPAQSGEHPRIDQNPGVGTRFIASKTDKSLVPPQSGEQPRIDQKSDLGTRFIASRTSEPLVPTQSREVPPIPQMLDASTQVVPHKSSRKKQRSSPSGEETSPLVPESDLIEPGFPPVYPPVQNRRTGTTATGKGAIAQHAESHESPTIRVTIGRIDVRAVPPPPPASPAPTNSNRPRPALSLSDYLKQRKGGQR